MGSKTGSSNLNEGNLVISTPGPPPYCLDTFSNSAFNSFSKSGVGSTRFFPLQNNYTCIGKNYNSVFLIMYKYKTIIKYKFFDKRFILSEEIFRNFLFALVMFTSTVSLTLHIDFMKIYTQDYQPS